VFSLPPPPVQRLDGAMQSTPASRASVAGRAYGEALAALAAAERRDLRRRVVAEGAVPPLLQLHAIGTHPSVQERACCALRVGHFTLNPAFQVVRR
jgi:pimeloyl-ACP methyl ester carboxylesterase